jgi:L-ascorbate metabolism protein UlaG (beta-lactamase superfamily)
MISTRGNQITWLGHSAFRVTTPAGNVVLIDPWLEGNPLCPTALKKPSRVDVILLTHGHDDHLGDTVALGKQHKPRIICIYETYVWLESKGVKNVTGMGKGGTVQAGDIEVTLTHAIHSNSIQDGDRVLYGGEPGGFIVRLPGGMTVYHAGDTAVFGDMKLIGELYSPDLACLPIGDLYTMGPREAAHAIRLLGVRHVIPMHYGTSPALTGQPEALREMTKDITDLEIYALKPGESLG